ncbi:MAG: VOC family protein [Pyrinomonadaceae bacterium]
MRTARSILFLMLLSIPASAQKESANPWVPAPTAPQYFAVRVGDIDRSAAWYKKVFGLRLLDDSKDPNGVWRIVNLVSDALFVELIWDSRGSNEKGGMGFFKIGYWVADVETIADRVGSATGDRPRVLDFEKHKLRLVQLRDPDGNILQFSSPLPEAKRVNRVKSKSEKPAAAGRTKNY